MDAHLADGNQPNRKNRRGKKRVRTSLGEVEISTLRDRTGSFQPKVIGKRQKQLPKDLERQIMSVNCIPLHLSIHMLYTAYHCKI